MVPVRLKLQALVADTLADPTSGYGYQATKLEFGDSVEITLRKDGSQFAIWLRPADHPTPCYKQTIRFKVGHRGDPPDRLGYALLDAVCRAIAVWERTLPDDAESQLFDAPGANDPRPAPSVAWSGHCGKPALEWLAVRSGLKPACRHLVRPEEASRIAEQARIDGLFACVTEARAFVEDFCGEGVAEGATTLVHVGRSEQTAALAADAEREMMAASRGGERVTGALVRALGAALGYPPCCVGAFLPMRDLSTAAIRFHALERTPGRVELLLNDVAEGRALVSHSVCRYDCAPSLRYARALLEEVRRIDAGAAEGLVRHLSGLVVSFRTGGSFRLAPVTNPDSRRYTFEHVEQIGTGPLCDVWGRVLRDANGLEVLDGEVSVLRGSDETARLKAPSDDVQIRLFAP